MTSVLLHLLKYDLKDKEKCRDVIYNYLKNNTNVIKPWALNPSRIFKLAVDLCIICNLKIDPLLIQAIIIIIQSQKIFQEFRFITDDKGKSITPKEVYREKYMDWCSFYNTYDIFNDFNKLIKNKLNNVQIDVRNIFDCDNDFDKFKTLALKYK